MSERARERPKGVAGREAASTLSPRSLAELRELVAGDDGAATLVPVGGGTQLELGNPPEEPFRLLDLREALAGEAVHEPSDMTVDVPAAMTLGELDRLLVQRKQFLPIDPPLAPNATIGGALSVGLAGPLRARYGLPRDYLLGLTMLRADGELVQAGGRVVKNVTGYDLMRLWCGSLGTLGLVTRVALRALPRFETLDLSAWTSTVDEGRALAEAVLRADVRPLVADLLSTGGRRPGWTLFLRVEEQAEAEARRRLGTGAMPAPAGLYETVRDLGFGKDDLLTIRLGGLPAGTCAAVAILERLRPGRILARPLAGFVRATWSRSGVPPPEEAASMVASLRALVAPARGSVIVERMPASHRAALETWGPPGGQAGLAQRVKEAYDPGGRFNRGRYVGGL